MWTLLAGFALSLSLIVAIGAQNAFVLRQGLLRQHVFAVCLFCGVSDAALITVGVAGFGGLATKLPWFEPAMRYGGAAFLVWYGWRNARSALAGGAQMQAAEAGQDTSLWTTLATLAALTYLNPHVYLDTIVLLGAISAQYDDRLAFGIGAAFGSLSFFFALGYGARLLAPIFKKPRAWQILDGVIALTMWAIAAGLIFG